MGILVIILSIADILAGASYISGYAWQFAFSYLFIKGILSILSSWKEKFYFDFLGYIDFFTAIIFFLPKIWFLALPIFLKGFFCLVMALKR